MPVICAAIGCNNKFVKGSEIRFYRFPLSKPQLSGKWVHSLGMKNFIPTANTCLCSEHFRADCFRDYNGKQFLREDAVPTIFSQGQDSSKIELRKRGVMPKEANVATPVATQAERDKAREVVSLRRDKRGGMRLSKRGPKTYFTPEEALKILEEDPGSTVCPIDSSSDDEDLVHPENTRDTSDSDYCLPSSESDEDYEPPLASVSGPSSVPRPTRPHSASELSQPQPGPAVSPPPTAPRARSLTPQPGPAAPPPPMAPRAQWWAPQPGPAAPSPPTAPHTQPLTPQSGPSAPSPPTAPHTQPLTPQSGPSASPPPTAPHTQPLTPQSGPSASPPPTAPHTQSLAPQPGPAASPPPTTPHTQSLAPQPGPSASPPTTPRKRGRPPLRTSAKRARSRLVSAESESESESESEEGGTWHDGAEKCIKPGAGPAASPPTTRRKRGRPPLRTSAKRAKSRLVSTESESESEVEEKPTERVEGGRWHDGAEECIKPDPIRFMPARIPGPACDTTSAWSPLRIFRLFFSATVVQKIIDNTNANAAERRKAGKKFNWEVLTMEDFYTFLAIIIFTGFVTVHHMADYWRKIWPYNFQFPGNSMTRDRFEAILWSLHLSDPKEDEENDKQRNTAMYDPLFKIKPLYTEMVKACKANFQPHQNLSINERMVVSKTCINVKQYMKDKPTKWDYKLFVLADASIGYTWNFFVHAGKSESPTGHGLSYSAVMDLLPFPLLGGGYLLYTDDFYTSPALFTDLATKNMGCCGTIRKTRVGFPKTQNNDLPKTAERGDMRWIRSGKLLFVKWMDTREVTMCSTVHRAFSGQTVRRKVKEAGVWQNKSVPVPDSVVDFNRSMGGMDLSDAMIGFCSVRHKTMKWYKTFFYHFMDIAVVNSYLLHKELFKLRRDPAQTEPFTHKTFREQLAMEMLEFADGSAGPPPPPPSPPPTCMPMFFDGEETRVRKYCKRCHNAGLLRVKTSTCCRKCKVPLCLTSKKNCFQLWHDGQ
ncbi:piggyBac transposable element-derived protein 5-like [Cebidichthys violaceus]|uniref:piggyBac transposable element-derived protein 5-like n=1 Tax=Cebidichthys violaceus TaxID=271503 RepID=UPI0035CAF718